MIFNFNTLSILQWKNLTAFITKNVLLRAHCNLDSRILPGDSDPEFIGAEMKVHDASMEFVDISAAEDKIREEVLGSNKSPQLLTSISMDKSTVMKYCCHHEYDDGWKGMIGELQLAFLLFMQLFSYPALNQWKVLIDAICHSEQLLVENESLTIAFLRVFYEQLNFSPSDFFTTELSKENFLCPALSTLFHVLSAKGLSDSVREHRKRLFTFVQKKFGLFEEAVTIGENSMMALSESPFINRFELVADDLPVFVSPDELQGLALDWDDLESLLSDGGPSEVQRYTDVSRESSSRTTEWGSEVFADCVGVYTSGSADVSHLPDPTVGGMTEDEAVPASKQSRLADHRLTSSSSSSSGRKAVCESSRGGGDVGTAGALGSVDPHSSGSAHDGASVLSSDTGTGSLSLSTRRVEERWREIDAMLPVRLRSSLSPAVDIFDCSPVVAGGSMGDDTVSVSMSMADGEGINKSASGEDKNVLGPLDHAPTDDNTGMDAQNGPSLPLPTLTPQQLEAAMYGWRYPLLYDAMMAAENEDMVMTAMRILEEVAVATVSPGGVTVMDDRDSGSDSDRDRDLANCGVASGRSIGRKSLGGDAGSTGGRFLRPMAMLASEAVRFIQDEVQLQGGRRG